MKIAANSRKKAIRNSVHSPRTVSLKIASPAVRRSQLIENKVTPEDIFQNWLLRTGHSPKAGLPASQIGIYTDFQ